MDIDEKIAALEKRIDSLERVVDFLVLRIDTSRADVLLDIYNAISVPLSKEVRRTEKSRAQDMERLKEFLRSQGVLEK